MATAHIEMHGEHRQWLGEESMCATISRFG